MGITSNRNGDVFILDTSNSCVHVVDRSVVSRVFFIGKYHSPSLQPYGSSKNTVTASEAKLSNQLGDITSNEDDIYILDQGRKEIIIVCEVFTAKSTPSKKIHILNVNALSITHNSNHLVLLLETNSGHSIEMIKPLFTDSKNYQLKINYETISSWSPQFALNSIFTMGKYVLGAVNTEGIICTYHISSKVTKITTEKSSNIASDGKPCVSGDGHLYILKGGCIHKHTFKYSKNENQLESISVEEIASNEVKSLHCWNTVLFFVKRVTTFSHSLEELGSLTFGLQLSEAINSFYEAIGYTKPGHGVASKRLTLPQCIEKAKPLVNILKGMTQFLRNQFSRSTFLGEFGTPWTITINCIIDTVDSWRALVRRLDSLHPSLSGKVYAHSVTSEAWMEHSPGVCSVKKMCGYIWTLLYVPQMFLSILQSED